MVWDPGNERTAASSRSRNSASFCLISPLRSAVASRHKNWREGVPDCTSQSS